MYGLFIRILKFQLICEAIFVKKGFEHEAAAMMGRALFGANI